MMAATVLRRRGAGDGYHVQPHGADAGHGLQLVDGERAARRGGYHPLVLADGDEGAGEAAHARSWPSRRPSSRRRSAARGPPWCRACRRPPGPSPPGCGPRCRPRPAWAPGRGRRCRRARPAAGRPPAPPAGPCASPGRRSFFTVSATTPKSAPRTARRAWCTTPGPETPTFITVSGSLTPWKAPAMKGLSSTALQNTTSLAQPKPPLRGGQLRSALHRLAHQRHGVHVYARAGGADIHARTDELRLRQGLRDGAYQLLIRRRHALLHQGGEAADEVHARGLPRARRAPWQRARSPPPPRPRRRALWA